MTRYYRPRGPEPRETLTAAALAAGVAVGVGAVTFYLTRLFLAREPLGERTEADEPAGTDRGATRDP